MLSAEHITWVGEPSEEDKKYFKEHGCWRRWTIWPYKAKFLNKKTGKWEPCPTTFVMNEKSLNIYQAELALLEKIRMVVSNQNHRELIDLIEKYGDVREEKGRADVEEDWAESESGADL